MMNNESAAAAPPQIEACYEAVVLTGGQIRRLVSDLRSVSAELHAPDVEAEPLTDNMLLWRDLDAALGDHPQLNFAAMELMLRLRGPVGVHPVYGDVLITGRKVDGNPEPLTEAAARDIRVAMMN